MSGPEHPLMVGRWPDPVARMTALTAVELQTPRLDDAVQFFSDFGLHVLHRDAARASFRAEAHPHAVVVLDSGPPALRRVVVEVDHASELSALGALPEAIPTEGGVDLQPPFGPPVRVVLRGSTEAPPAVAPLTHRAYPDRVDAPLRLPARPSAVRRLGHAVLDSPDPPTLALWWMQRLGMIVSDVQHLDGLPRPAPAVAFLRCDLGEALADHHTIAVGLGPLVGLGHLAFEVDSVDEIGLGNRWLADHGYRHEWGIGRHILGSQLFDYWRTPDGMVCEHYADGDLVTSQAPTGHHRFAGSALAQWGPPVPAGFGVPPITPTSALKMGRALLTPGPPRMPWLWRAGSALRR